MSHRRVTPPRRRGEAALVAGIVLTLLGLALLAALALYWSGWIEPGIANDDGLFDQVETGPGLDPAMDRASGKVREGICHA